MFGFLSAARHAASALWHLIDPLAERGAIARSAAAARDAFLAPFREYAAEGRAVLEGRAAVLAYSAPSGLAPCPDAPQSLQDRSCGVPTGVDDGTGSEAAEEAYGDAYGEYRTVAYGEAPPAWGAVCETTVDDYPGLALLTGGGAIAPPADEGPAEMEVTTAANAPAPLYRVRRRIPRDGRDKAGKWVVEAPGVSAEDAATLGEFWESRGWDVDVSQAPSRRRRSSSR